MAAKDLAQLVQLDRSKLYIFVAGPGKGEAIAVALPQAGWVIVDGCRAAVAEKGEDLPLAAIVNRWGAGGADRVHSALLTHPHRDHADGFARLVDQFAPETVGVVACPAKDEHPLDDAIRWLESDRPATGFEKVRKGSERAAVRKIVEWERKNPGSLRLLQDGATVPTGVSPATISVVAPAVDALQAFWRSNDLVSRFKTRANRVSAVCVVHFGRTHIVLTGDLPYSANGRPIPSGWERVAKDHPEIPNHAGLKVPHHGSIEAHHAGWMGDGGVARCWCATPFNSSELPGLADGEGLSELLKKQKTIRLSALPASREVQAAVPNPGRVEFAQLVRRRDALRTGVRFIDEGIDIKPATACGPLDAVWVFEYGDGGELTGTWRGSAAIEVYRAPKMPPGVLLRPKADGS